MHTCLRLPPARRVSDALFLVVLSLIVLSTLGQASKYLLGHPKLMGFVGLFYVDDESTLPTWYSSAALALAGGLLAVIAAAKWQTGDRYRLHWTALAGIFFLLSADEVSMLHELPIQPMRDAFHTGGMLYYPWVLPAAVLVMLVGLSYVPLVWHLPVRTRLLVIFAGCTFLSGALGAEMFSAVQADQWGEQNLTYALIITAEEFLEMLGVVIFIKALLEYLQTQLAGLRLEFAPAASAPAA